MRGTAWSSSFPSYSGYSIPVGSGAQLVTLPWGNINQIEVVFNENVVVDKSDLALSGVNVSEYDIADSTFAYYPTTCTATWTLPTGTFLNTDKLMLELNADGTDPIHDFAGKRLDGDWTNPTSTTDTGTSTYPSGDGTAGGDFLFRFNVLPGDASGDGTVNGSDLATLGQHWKQSGGSAQGDFNGDGTVDASDLALLGLNWRTSLPSTEPVASLDIVGLPGFSSSVAAVPGPGSTLASASGAVTASADHAAATPRDPELPTRRAMVPLVAAAAETDGMANVHALSGVVFVHDRIAAGGGPGSAGGTGNDGERGCPERGPPGSAP